MNPEAGTLGAQLRSKLAAIRLNAEVIDEKSVHPGELLFSDYAREILDIVDEALPLTEQADRDAAQHEGSQAALSALRLRLTDTEQRLAATEQALGAAKEAAAATALGDLWVAEAGAPASGGGSTSGGAEAQDGDASADLCICGHEAGEHYYEGECLFRVSDPNGSPIGATYCECNEFARAY